MDREEDSLMKHKILHIIETAENVLLCICMSALVLTCFFQVIGRYTPLPFSSAFEEIAVNTFVWMTLLGAGVCVRTRSHMRMDIIDTVLPARFLPFMDILRNGIVLLVFGFACKISAQYIPIAKRTGMTTSALDLPQYILYLALPLGFALMVLWSVVNIVSGVQGLRKGNTDAPVEEREE